MLAAASNAKIGRQDYRIGQDIKANVIETSLTVAGIAVDHQTGTGQTASHSIANPETAGRNGRQVAAEPHQECPSLLPAILLQDTLHHHMGRT